MFGCGLYFAFSPSTYVTRDAWSLYSDGNLGNNYCSYTTGPAPL